MVEEDYQVVGANYMSPDGDGINDRLIIKGLDVYPNNVVRIDDRCRNNALLKN